MSRPIHRLTIAQLRNLPARGKLADGGNLFLQIRGPNASWILRYSIGGRERHAGLGVFDRTDPAGSLAAARRKAAQARELLAKGMDPLAPREAPVEPARVPTFRDLAEQYVAAHELDWKNEVHRRQWRQTLADYVYPIIGDRTVDAIGLDDVKRVLEPIWRTKPETARRVRGRIEAILDLAITSGARKAANPASVRLVRQMLGKGKRRVKHHAAYPWQTLPAWLEPIAERTDVAARALVFLILTAARSSEARKARWVEIDTHRRLWILPHDRMKMEAPHTVPLSRQALAIVEAMRPLKISPYVFPGRAGNPISDSSLRNILREYGVTKDVGTLHGMRSAFRDWAAESGVPEPVAEAALSHQIGDATVAAYRRTRHLEERREVMQKWADFVL